MRPPASSPIDFPKKMRCYLYALIILEMLLLPCRTFLAEFFNRRSKNFPNALRNRVRLNDATSLLKNDLWKFTALAVYKRPLISRLTWRGARLRIAGYPMHRHDALSHKQTVQSKRRIREETRSDPAAECRHRKYPCRK